MRRSLFALLCLALLATAARADEIRLKNGSKIVGTIVGFQGNSFKIRTNYGFAVVRKDSIAAIIPGRQKETGTGDAKTSGSAGPKKSGAEKADAAARPALPTAPPRAAGPMKPPIAPVSHALTAGTPAPPAPAVAPALGAVVPGASSAAPAPPPPPEPPPVRELVRGSEYINQTYGFQMYRPPDWNPIPEARRALPNAVAALGTYDQQTLLVIGRSPADKSLPAQAGDTEKALRQIYENYRPLASKRITVSGVPAIERQFRGLADGHDWWVCAVTLKRGKDAFTILGMTYSDSDLIQIQENVIGRVIASLEFATKN